MQSRLDRLKIQGWPESRQRQARHHRLSLLGITLLALANSNAMLAEEEPPHAKIYQSRILPLVQRYCFECHAKETTEADIDFAAMPAFSDARRHTRVWLKARRMLGSEQMPPKDSDQLTDAERRQLLGWIRSFLAHEARARAGDPGPITLRRLTNAEYNYSVADLTGVTSLNPTAEFPVDGAAGEGFTNIGIGQGMSPALASKYLDAGKEVASHAMLVPDGIRFSPYITRRDRTNNMIARIQNFYHRFAADRGGSAVDWQGKALDSELGGRLAIEEYLRATLIERDALLERKKTLKAVATENRLNEKYLTALWRVLSRDSELSPFTASFRRQWQLTTPDNGTALTAWVKQSQDALWKFNTVGTIGRDGGPSSWLEPVSSIVEKQELRIKLPDAVSNDELFLYLSANDLNDGNEHDIVIWEQPRFEFKSEGGTTSISLRDSRSLSQRIDRAISTEAPRTTDYLRALVQQQESSASMAAKHKLNPQLLNDWGQLVGLGRQLDSKITGLLTNKLTKIQGYDALNGWGQHSTPSMMANRSANSIAFSTLSVPARSVTMHPSPTKESVVVWQSPMEGKIAISALVADADSVCGNGVAWRVEVISALGTTVPFSASFDNGGSAETKTDDLFSVHVGDRVLLIVNPRDRNHGCDTTHIDLTLTEVSGKRRSWNLSKDVVDHIHQSNILPDSYGNKNIWYFCARESGTTSRIIIEPDSALARWRLAVSESKSLAELNTLAGAVQHVLTATSDASQELSGPDRRLRRKLRDWKGPLGWGLLIDASAVDGDVAYGLAPSLFGKGIKGGTLPANNLMLRAPNLLEIRLPARVFAGAEFTATCRLASTDPASTGSVQVQALTTKPTAPLFSPAKPILVSQKQAVKVQKKLSEFRDLFPPALCYARIIPVDEVVTLTLFFREDDRLRQLMLNDQEASELDRLWDELLFVSQEPLKLVVAFEQISEFATQDRPDLVKAFVPMEKPIHDRAQAFRERLIETEPVHLGAVLEFAQRAWRRPLTSAEQQNLRRLYKQLRGSEIPHKEAIRLTLARTLAAPAFLYKLEEPGLGKQARSISNHELATRLSYFLWSSLPDEQLSHAARADVLTDRAELLSQTRRMLKSSRTRRLAIQFACQWLHVRGFDTNDDKNEKLFPEFATLREDMYEESVLFFENLFRQDDSILEILNADHSFLNGSMAEHYGIGGVSDSHWRRVNGMKSNGRGGILGMATILASQSGASRTSPILRGNWVFETLLGQHLPKPPANVPQLPETVPSNLTARQLIERHSSVDACAKCHAKIDPYGFALEQFDAIGRLRGQAVNTRTVLPDGQTIDGIKGLRNYLLTDRRDEFLRQFCRKLLGFALGRELILSDEPLLDTMLEELSKANYRFSVAVETIVLSPQFRQIRGRDIGYND